MQGDKRRVWRWMVWAASIFVTGIMAILIGSSGSAAGAATNGTRACVTPTALPTGTQAPGTLGPSPTVPPPTATATAPRIVGPLLGGDPTTATVTASPTPLPICTPAPPTKAPLTATPIAPATVYSSGAPGTGGTAASSAAGGSPAAVVARAPSVPASTPTRVSVQAASAPASVVPPASAPSSAQPPAAALGLPPSPPPGYSPPVGNTPNMVGGANGPAVPPVVGTPVISAVRGRIAPAGAPVVPFPGVPAAARPAVSPAYVVGPTGAPIPIITPRTGHPGSVNSMTVIALVAGVACMCVGVWLRRGWTRRAIRM